MTKNKIAKVVRSIIERGLSDAQIKELKQRRLEKRLFCKVAPGSYTSHYSYSVVTAIYNTDEYLRDFFDSLLNQTIAADSLTIIAVDDGSSDSSAEIVRQYQEEYPGRIIYVYQENGGAASARSRGLQFVESDYVSFIDSDDFVSADYFEVADKLLFSRPNIKLISSKYIFFYEEINRFSDTHPLCGRFKKTRLYNVQDERRPIQLSMNSVILHTQSLRDSGVVLNKNIKPDFEDADFINRYMLSLDEGLLAFVSEMKYYYRKRATKNSLIDTSWEPGNGKIELLPRIYLELLQHAKHVKSRVPAFVQRTILYVYSWYLKRFVGHRERSSAYLSNGASDQFLSTTERIFNLIDPDVLEKVPGAWIRSEWKQALAWRYLDTTYPTGIIYVERIEPDRKKILIRSIFPEAKIFIEGKEVLPDSEKKQTSTFFGREFCTLYYRWYSYESEEQIFSWHVPGSNRTDLSIRGKKIYTSQRIANLVKHYTSEWSQYSKEDIWIVMDRDTQADDNGEHFYRWLKKHHPEQRCYFVLRKTSKDWDRLQAEGFNLLDFGSKQHECILRKCSKIISSHADAYVYSYFGDSFYRSKDYILLQHGVIHNDLSQWLNSKPITLFITTTEKEKQSIVGSGSSYSITPDRVVLSGLPRHDALLDKARKDAEKKTILLMPTWRKNITGAMVDLGNDRLINEDFSHTRYKMAWESLLNSPELKQISDTTGYKIVFFPHANIAPYMENGMFSIPDYVEIESNSLGYSIQETFVKAAVLITDYSSVAFEATYINTPVIYYHFDRDEFFSGAHGFAEGYFKYEQDGFGPVVHSEDDALKELDALAKNGFTVSEPYKTRMEKTFAFRDGKCCERVYNAIIAQDE